PLYVGVMSLFVGLSLLIGTWWGLVVLIPVFLILHSGVVLREEAYLERRFGVIRSEEVPWLEVYLWTQVRGRSIPPGEARWPSKLYMRLRAVPSASWS